MIKVGNQILKQEKKLRISAQNLFSILTLTLILVNCTSNKKIVKTDTNCANPEILCKNNKPIGKIFYDADTVFYSQKFKKIIIFDTLAQQLSPVEIEAVIAHELGHYVANHTLKFYLVFSVLSLFIFWLATHLVDVNNPLLGLATCLLLIPSVTFFLNPLIHAMSRQFESQADQFAATHHEKNTIASALIKLHQQNHALPDADRLYMRWYYSHPTLNDRLHALNRAPSSTNPPG